MALEDNTKKDLANMVRELESKLKELQKVEKAQTASLDDLHQLGIGVFKDDKGDFFTVKLKFDSESKAAAIESIDPVNSKDAAIAYYQVTKYVQETIMRKIRGGKYDK